MKSPCHQQALTYGLTGGIGCGKSTAADLLKQRGWWVLDTDELARCLLEPGQEGYKKVVDAFGGAVLKKDLSIDRSCLGRIVFSDDNARRRLNSILHPLIRNQWQSALQTHRVTHPGTNAVVVIPLLFEVGAEAAFDRTVCIGCCAMTQHERLIARGWNTQEIHSRLRAQWPLAEKIKYCDHVIWNDGSQHLLRAQLERLPAR